MPDPDPARLARRLMASQANRDGAVARLIDACPLARLVDRVCRDEGLSEADALKVLAVVLAAERDRLADLLARRPAPVVVQWQPPAAAAGPAGPAPTAPPP